MPSVSVSKSAPRAVNDAGLNPAVLKFKLLADPLRLRVLLLLAPGEIHVSELCDALGQAQPAMSHHLALLRLSGLVEWRREGRRIFYRLTRLGDSAVRMARELMQG